MENHFQYDLKSQLMIRGANLIGFADVSWYTFDNNSELCSAISIGVLYDSDIVNKLDVEVDNFEKHLLSNMKKMENLLAFCKDYLRKRDFTVWVPPISKNLPGLISNFSHKMAATQAGLGWIGKSSLFVSYEYGCGLTLASVLTNASFITGKPIIESQCGECNECVEACPYKAIKNVTWYPGIQRNELIDAALCSVKREEFISKLGYKHPCGLCIKACPIGK